MEEGLFRQDLYYRLQVLSLEIPPLRQRDRDVLMIAERFLENIADQTGEKKKSFSPEAEEEMLSYQWPGNIRELKNVVNRITLLAKGDTIERDDIQTAIYSKGFLVQRPDGHDEMPSEGYPLMAPEERIAAKKKEVEAANISLIREALQIAGGNKGEAARLIGVSRKTMYNMVHKYDIE